MPSKGNKMLVKFVEDHGYTYTRTNGKHFDYYAHPIHGEVAINPSVDEHTAKSIVVSLQKKLGIATDASKSKRSPEAIKEREAAERERLAAEIARHEAEILELLAQRDRRMDGLGRLLTGQELRDIEQLIARKQRELRGWQSLMTAIPAPRADAGRPGARHRS